jgi:F-type H+-transporting ATPase subunit gamma
MAEDLASVRARIRGVQQLDAVIGAMRGIAAAYAQQSRELLPGVRAYSSVVAQGMAQALQLQDTDARSNVGRGDVARIVFSAEQGFVGGFAEHVLAEAATRPPADVFLLGTRGRLFAPTHGIIPVWQNAMATQPAGISGLCMRVAEALYEWMSTRNPCGVEVVYPTWSRGATVAVTYESLLPLDPSRLPLAPGIPPLTMLPPQELLERLADEYIFAALCEAAMHALVAENEVRASAMVRARAKMQDMLEDLALTEHRMRQEAITAELVELASAT